MAMTQTITDTTSPLPGDVVLQVQIDDITPDPKNRKPANVDDLVPSIKAIGIIEPIILRPHVNGDAVHYMIVAGERRWRAAKKAQLPAVPAIVRDLDDQSAAEHRLVENVQREDIAPLDEAKVYAELLAFDGWTQRKIVDRVGRSQSHISKRLALLELPKEAIAKLHSGGITLTGAVALTKLKDHPKILVEVLQRCRWAEDLEHDVDQAVEGIRLEKEKAALRAELEEKGVKILDHALGYGHRLESYELDGVDKRKHRKEPCHAVTIDTGWKGQTRTAVTLEYCTTPARHAKAGASDLKTKRPGRSSGPQKSEATKKKEAAEREATKQRRGALAGLLTRKPPKDLWQRIASRYVDDAAHVERQKICELLGIEVPVRKRYGADHRDCSGAVDAYAAQSDAHLQQVAFAFYIVQGEFQPTWGTDNARADANRQLLLDAGYEPHPGERSDFTRAKKTTRT